ncbi:unnamed protein product [Penicillium olsonii]|nr:unnamed protein product [Penicillium olsonii]
MNGRSPVLIIWSVIMLLIGMVAVGLRIASIRTRRREVKVHDYLVFFSMVSISPAKVPHRLTVNQLMLAGYVTDMVVGMSESDHSVRGWLTGQCKGSTVAGYGGHTQGMSITHPVELRRALKIFWASEWIWSTATTSFRLAIILLYMEIFPGNRKFVHGAIGVGALVTLYWVATIFVLSFLCQPIEYNWNHNIPGRCGDVRKILYASAGFNMVMDLVVVLLPLPVIWGLRMSSRKKMGVTTSFAIGILTAGINLARIVQTRMCPSEDPIWCTRDSSLLMIAEMTAGIWVACVPTFGPLISRRKKTFTRQHHLPTIGSARMRPHHQAKSDSLLSTLNRSQHDSERTDGSSNKPVTDHDPKVADIQEVCQDCDPSINVPLRVLEDSRI